MFAILDDPSIRALPIDHMEVSVRTANALLNYMPNGTYADFANGARLKTVGDLCDASEQRLLETPNFGRKALNELKTVLERLGAKIANPVPLYDPPLRRDQILGQERSIAALALRRQGLTFKEIGKRMGVCGNRARQLVFRGERYEKVVVFRHCQPSPIATAAALSPAAGGVPA